MMADTSLQAYDPESMETLRMEIYNLIKGCNMLSNRDIAHILGKENGTVSGRTNELAKDGLIRAWTRKVDNMTGRSVKVWEAM